MLGRQSELERLCQALGRAEAVALIGEAGIGKTTLLLSATSGRRAYFGGGLGMLSLVPYLPLTRAVGALPAADEAAVARTVITRVAGGVLVLDDLQWADEATLSILARLAGTVSLLGAVRSGDGGSAAARAALAAAGIAELDVGPLSEQLGIDLARRVSPRLRPAAARQLNARAAGNPLLIEQLARSGVTSSLRLSLLHRIRPLDAAARELLEMVALADGPLVVAPSAELEALHEAGLVVIGERGVEIRHALIAEVVADELSAARRRDVHRVLARWVVDDVRAARHLAEAGDLASANRRAMKAASGKPAGLRAAMLGLAAECAVGAGATEQRLVAAEALTAAGMYGDAERLLELLPAVDAPVRARRHLVRSQTRWALGDGDGSLREAEAGVRLTGSIEPALAAALSVQLAWVLTLRREANRAVPLAESALAEVEARGLPAGPAKRVLATAMSIAGEPMERWQGLLEEALVAARELDDLGEELLCAKIIVSGYEGSGDAVEGDQRGREFLARARQTGMVSWELTLRASLISLDNSQGHFERVVEQADALLAEPLDRRARAQTAGYLGLALVDLGRFDEALWVIEDGLQQSTDDVDGQFDLLWARVELGLATGDPAVAERVAADCLARFGTADYGDVRFVRIARDWAQFDQSRALDPMDTRAPSLHPIWHGTAPEARAIRLLADGADPSAAGQLFTAAAQAYAAYHRRSEMRCLWAQGEALRRAGQLAEARQVLERAEERAAGLAMAALGARISRSLRLAGSRRSAARIAGGRLSGREREVLRLVAAGLTNAQIAARLGIGRPTVARIVASASTKLGSVSRAQAALAALHER